MQILSTQRDKFIRRNMNRPIRQHKQKNYSICASRRTRADEINERRCREREENKSRARNITSATVNNTEDSNNGEPEIKSKLEAWKEQRAMKKKLEAQKKKPAFKAGIPNYRTPDTKKNSSFMCCHCKRHPANCKSPTCSKHVKTPEPERYVSSVTKRRLELRGIDLSPSPSSSSESQKHISNEKKKNSFAPKDHLFKVPLAVKSLPIFSEFKYIGSNRLNIPTINITPSTPT